MSRHHWMYFGCQCSSARCRRLLLERPTLLGIFSALIIESSQLPAASCQLPAGSWKLEAGSWKLSSSEVELRPQLGTVRGQRTLGAHGVGPLEDPVLPRGQPSEDLR